MKSLVNILKDDMKVYIIYSNTQYFRAPNEGLTNDKQEAHLYTLKNAKEQISYHSTELSIEFP